MKVRDFYHKYINWIVAILTVLFLFKGCQSCSRERVIEYNSCEFNKREQVLIDSIDAQNDIIQYKDFQIDSLSNIIINRDFQLNILNNEVEELRGLNTHFRTTNTTLINTNRELSNKTEE